MTSGNDQHERVESALNLSQRAQMTTQPSTWGILGTRESFDAGSAGTPIAATVEIDREAMTNTPHRVATGLSVVIPVFNESETVVEVIRRVLAQPLVTEVLVVDDGSSDGTSHIMQSVAWPPMVRLLAHPQNQGKGAAVRTGIAAASQGVIIIQDADFEYDPADYPTVVQPILEGRADVVYGSRFLTPRPYAFWLDLANRCLTVATNVMYGSHLTDMETCYKAFRSELLQSITIRSDRFDFEPEITAKVLRRRCRLVEVPISYERRGYESGKKIQLRDAFSAMRALFRYRFRD